MKKILLIACFIGGFSIQNSYSQQFVYRAVNPFFGGDTFNYQFLLQSAQAQNSFTDPNEETRNQQQSELERFSQNLNNQLLNQISRSLFSQQFGDDGQLAPGTFSFGSLVVEIFESTEGLVIDILDTNNGDQTQVVIPGGGN
ncbi:curli assembly protein CsgF [Winogradskyella sp. PC-19]|uniref:curli assembly protein CsgF n=1 Tax=unclassified Winogradskyella TaxID=2615021 RepID=UPI000B3C08F0|nr:MULTISPECIES: curli assembly protein CsgF [unclassified Winogradskyella]ARV09072.1 curli assembly protein CsgF [Winogradskyella sp. PC-19]RZN81404.1 MAG: curli assembly protein CsgF [Winogradskyella sp.]